MSDVVAGRITRRDRFGNFQSDVWAKFGGQLARAPADDQRRMQQAEQFVEQVGQRIGELGAHVDARDTTHVARRMR
eukprot:685549-Pyramimonas_sp.AAC.1